MWKTPLQHQIPAGNARGKTPYYECIWRASGAECSRRGAWVEGIRPKMRVRGSIPHPIGVPGLDVDIVTALTQGLANNGLGLFRKLAQGIVALLGSKVGIADDGLPGVHEVAFHVVDLVGLLMWHL